MKQIVGNNWSVNIDYCFKVEILPIVYIWLQGFNKCRGDDKSDTTICARNRL